MTKTTNYLIVANDKISIDSLINKIVSGSKEKDLEIIKYTYPEIGIPDVLEELNTYNFLSNCKLIVFYNCTFLSKDSDKAIKEFKKYIENPSDNYLILVNDSLSDRKEIKELIASGIEVVENKTSIEEMIKSNLDFCTMDDKTIKYFIGYCLGNNEKILNELEKIKCYKYSENDKNITIKDINSIVMKDYDEDIFDLVNAIANRNREKSFDIYGRIREKEKDSVNIIASVSSNIRNLYSVRVLLEKKYKQNEISNILGIKPYAVQIASERCGNYSKKKLLYFLNTLADIDYKTKSGSGRGNALFEMFLLNL
jgi:DNA polymerase-3 subunit delta